MPFAELRGRNGTRGQEEAMRGQGWAVWTLVGVLLGLCLACCGVPQPQQPGKQQVQSDSDRFFEKMRQEEHEHSAGP